MKFAKLVKKTQPELKSYLAEFLTTHGYKVTISDGWLYGDTKDGGSVLLTAHLDTVHKEPVKSIVYTEGGNVVSSPQGIGGDDRCGVWIITEIISKTELRPPVLFCEDEEIGGVGSDKFLKAKEAKQIRRKISDMKFIIELDRANANDAVFYDCDNPEFTDWITETTGLKEAWGSFSDISNLCPDLGIAGVNISCGYYKAHTVQEYVVLSEMKAAAETTIKLLNAAADKSVPAFEYIEAIHKPYSWSYGDADYGFGYGYKKSSYTRFGGVWISWFDGDDELEDYFSGDNLNECFGEFFRTYPTVCWNDIADYEFY